MALLPELAWCISVGPVAWVLDLQAPFFQMVLLCKINIVCAAEMFAMFLQEPLAWSKLRWKPCLFMSDEVEMR